jgi:hypothetical protein
MVGLENDRLGCGEACSSSASNTSFAKRSGNVTYRNAVLLLVKLGLVLVERLKFMIQLSAAMVLIFLSKSYLLTAG